MMFKITIFAAVMVIGTNATCSCNADSDGDAMCVQVSGCTTENACDGDDADACADIEGCNWQKTWGCEYDCVVGENRTVINPEATNDSLGEDCSWNTSTCGETGEDEDGCDIDVASACAGKDDQATLCNAENEGSGGTSDTCTAIIGCQWTVVDGDSNDTCDEDTCSEIATEDLCEDTGADKGLGTKTSCVWLAKTAFVDAAVTRETLDFSKVTGNLSCQHLNAVDDDNKKCTWSPASLYTLSVCGLVLGYIL